jgi:hypothetical protein
LLAEQTQWDGGHHPCIRKPGGSRTIRSIPSSRCQTSPRAQRARANSSTLPRNAAGTGCLDPLARAGKRKCARPKNDSGAEGTGGARRDRTDDLMLAKHALSQLSYGPFGRRPKVLFGLRRRRSHPRSWLPRYQARRPFGLWFGWSSPGQSMLKMSARARRARKAEWPPALMRGKPRSRT